jgi:MBG domain (YGX type)
MTYGGPVPSLTASYSGFVNGDSVSSLTDPAMCRTTAPVSRRSAVGTYQITCGFVVDHDYRVSYEPGSLTVRPAPLTITADDQTMAYGSAAPAFTASYSGFVNGDTASVVSGLSCGAVDANGGPVGPTTAPGTYPITCSGASAANYAVSYQAGVLTIEASAGQGLTPTSTTVTTSGPGLTTTASTTTTAVDAGTTTTNTPGTTATTSPSGAGATTTTATTPFGGGAGQSSTTTTPAPNPGTTGTTVPATTVRTIPIPETTTTTTTNPPSTTTTASASATAPTTSTGSSASSGGRSATGSGSSSGGSSLGGEGQGGTPANRPKAASLAPAVGPIAGGTTVVVRGKWFDHVEEVSFGSHGAHFKVVSAEEVMARSPKGSGTVAVVVTTPGGVSAKGKPGRFAYTAGEDK